MLNQTVMILDQISNVCFVLVHHLHVIIHTPGAQEGFDFKTSSVKNVLHSERHRQMNIDQGTQETRIIPLAMDGVDDHQMFFGAVECHPIPVAPSMHLSLSGRHIKPNRIISDIENLLLEHIKVNGNSRPFPPPLAAANAMSLRKLFHNMRKTILHRSRASDKAPANVT